jgi:hypothetical protein
MHADWVGEGVLGLGVRLAAGVYVEVGGLSIGVTVVVGVALTVSLAVGRMVASDTAMSVEDPMGCARLICWQEDKNINRTQAMINFLSTFGVYHKIHH